MNFFQTDCCEQSNQTHTFRKIIFVTSSLYSSILTLFDIFQYNLTFVVTDSKGASTTYEPTINLCVCKNHGVCTLPELGNEGNSGNQFVIMDCTCSGGYTGRFCDSQLNACELSGQPCYPSVDCEDLPPPAGILGYKCGDCPKGYLGDGAKCAGKSCSRLGFGFILVSYSRSFLLSCLLSIAYCLLFVTCLLFYYG